MNSIAEPSWKSLEKVDNWDRITMRGQCVLELEDQKQQHEDVWVNKLAK